MTMWALRFDGRDAAVVERPEPEPGDGQAIVRPRVAGICNTDLEILRGYMGFEGVLGHELIGTVEQGPDAWRGRRVTAEINFACGRCDDCDRGLGRHCPHRTVMGILGQDGAFAERVAVPVANLHEVPDALSDAHAVFVEPLAAAFEILEQIRVAYSSEAVVLGDGKLGLLIAQVLKTAGVRVLLVGKHAEHLDLARGWGISASELDAWDRTPRDLVVDATGSKQGFELALEAVRPRGTLVMKTTVAEREAVNLAPLVINEITVVGSRCGPFEPALAALRDGRVQVAELVDARYPLEDGVKALERAGARAALKVLLEIAA
jgi:threonine dehydrogenase-like Zn-dependent dehydrogenase